MPDSSFVISRGASKAVGIDLGTTNTVIARHGQPFVIDETSQSPFLASAVAFPPNGDPLVGLRAVDRRVIDARNTLLSTKQLIGATMGSQRARRFLEHHPYELAEADGVAGLKTRAGIITPEQVAAMVISTALEAAQIEADACRAIVTVPAAFTNTERDATLRGIHACGFSGASIVSEPVATAVAYLASSNLEHALVFDLGGGTFDASVLRCQREPEVLSTAGDLYLGGGDVDREFAIRLAQQVLQERRWDLTSDLLTFDRLVRAAEQAKIQLTDSPRVALMLHDIDPAGPWKEEDSLVVEADFLDPIVEQLSARTLKVCDQALEKAELEAKNVQAVFLAGGSTYLPGIRKALSEKFGGRLRRTLNPMTVVAMGASLIAARPKLATLYSGVA